MTLGAIDPSQRKAATVVGWTYLVALPPAIFAEFYVRTRLIAFDDAAQTARNIMAHERLFRLGTASNLTVFARRCRLDHRSLRGPHAGQSKPRSAGHGLGADRDRNPGRRDAQRLRRPADPERCGLPACIRCEPVAGPGEALARCAWRCVQRRPGARRASKYGLLLSLARVPLHPESIGRMGNSRVLSSMGASAFSFIVFPELAKVVPVGIYGAPIFFFELTMGFWLLLKGLPRSGAAPDGVREST